MLCAKCGGEKEVTRPNSAYCRTCDYERRSKFVCRGCGDKHPWASGIEYRRERWICLACAARIRECFESFAEAERARGAFALEDAKMMESKAAEVDGLKIENRVCELCGLESCYHMR